MRPLKASLLFLYCLAALTAVGTAVSQLWNTTKQMREPPVQLVFRPAATAAGEQPS